MTKRFRVLLEPVKGLHETAQISIPFNVYEAFGTRARVAVRGTINGFPFRSSIFPMGDGKFYMVINKAMRDGGKVKPGEVASFVMEKDDAPRTIETPDDFAKALKANRAAQAVWERLSYTHRREYIQSIEEAKRPETRIRRIDKAVEMIAGMKTAENHPKKRKRTKSTTK